MRDGLPEDTRRDARAGVDAVRTQYPIDLLGTPRDGLRLTWRAHADCRQVGYQIRWRGDHSGTGPRVASADSIGVAVPGPALESGEVRRYAVRIATSRGWSTWSEELVVEAGLDRDALTARPIGGIEPTGGPVVLLRREFSLPAGPLRARLRATFWGVGEIRLNGRDATGEHLTPGWTSYDSRVLMGTWDVTDELEAGANTIGALLADGWYRGKLGWEGQTEHYGTETAALVQLDVECVDGTHVRVATSSEWTTSTGAVRFASLYDGIDADLRQDPGAWDTSGFDDRAWARARVVAVDTATVEPRVSTGVRTIGEWPASIGSHEGVARIDTGQNISGWLRLVVTGQPGERVVVRHAEVLDPDGSLHTRSLRTARAADTYVLATSEPTILEPRFTVHGFQYADVIGADVLSATSVAISSADVTRSHFSSSHPLLDRLHANTAWSLRSNFVSLPTDCPQRDERLGWTGDAQAFAPTASTLVDSEAFWRSWLRDVALEQHPDGNVPSVVPDVLGRDRGEWTHGRAGWGDVVTIAPWAIYESYGSAQILEEALGSMRRWVGGLDARASGGLLPTEFQFGDWLDPDAPADEPWKAKVSPDFVANAFFARSAGLLAKTEALVGDPGRADDARRLAERVARDTWRRWGQSATATPTGAALALEFDIAPVADRRRIGEQLARRVREDEGRISTGFLGTPLILHALAHTGHVDEAYLMLLRVDPPSWLYQVEMGATSIWERWDALSPDGSILAAAGDAADGSGMISFNHYAYGSVIDWVYRHVAGLAPTREQPGYRRIVVAPRPATTITAARASIETRLGPVSIDWRTEGSEMSIDLVVPYGAEAVLDLPLTADSTVDVADARHDDRPLGPGRHRISVTAVRIADPHAATPTREDLS